MYVFIKRTVPPPSMLIFDASNRDQCEVQRGRTNTPLQALVMMNDPHVSESSRVLASTMAKLKLPVDEVLSQVFRKIVCRTPQAKELAILKKYLEAEQLEFQRQPKKIRQLMKVGEYQKNQALDNAFTAALMQTIQMIYNMEETLMRV